MSRFFVRHKNDVADREIQPLAPWCCTLWTATEHRSCSKDPMQIGGAGS